MSIDNLYTSAILADRLQRARREAFERVRPLEQGDTLPSSTRRWLGRLQRAFRRAA